MLKRRHILKTIVFQRLIEIRVIKNRPKIGALLEMFKGKQDKEKLINHLKKLYDSNPDQVKIEESFRDIKFERLMLCFERMNTTLEIQQQSFGAIDKKISKLILRR